MSEPREYNGILLVPLPADAPAPPPPAENLVTLTLRGLPDAVPFDQRLKLALKVLLRRFRLRLVLLQDMSRQDAQGERHGSQSARGGPDPSSPAAGPPGRA